jgi:hypothetical protein
MNSPEADASQKYVCPSQDLSLRPLIASRQTPVVRSHNGSSMKLLALHLNK